MNFKDWFIKENFEQWNGRWVHFSHGTTRYPPYLNGTTKGNEKIPLLKINYNMMWNDPLGIYFFPEKFKTEGGWHNYEFKYIVEFPKDMRVLDMGNLTKAEFDKILKNNNIEPVVPYNFTKEQPPSYYFYQAIKKRFEDKRTGGVLKSKLNKFFRELGYDAIFDDTNGMYHGETQLILLNPAINYKVLDVVRNSTSGWNQMSQVIARVEQLCKVYGKVNIRRDNKKYSGWDHGNVLKARVYVNEDKYKEGPFVYWELSTARIEKDSPTEIHVCLGSTTPDFKSSGYYTDRQCAEISFRTMDFNELDELIEKVMKKTFSQSVAA